MTVDKSDEKAFSDAIKPGKTCFRCNRAIYFSSERKNPLTDKVVALDPETNENHLCKQEDVNSYRETEEYKKRIEEWKSKHQSSQTTGSISSAKAVPPTSDPTNNNSLNVSLEKIASYIDRMSSNIQEIKNKLQAHTDRSSAGEQHLNEDKKLQMEK